MFEEIASTIVVVGGIVFGLVETFKPVYDLEHRVDLGDKVSAALFSVVLCIAGSVNAFPAIGLPLSVPYMGEVLTGFLIVGSSKVLHDLLGVANASQASQ